MMNKYLWPVAIAALALAACGKKEEAPAPAASAPVAAAPAEEKVLNIYNWPDYVPEGMIAAFEKETGIKVNYDTFETNEALNAKLVAGSTGYDIVVPGTTFSPAQTEAGFFQPLDRAKLKNYGNLDPAIMMGLVKADPGNKHLVPWAWGFTTVGINRTKVEKAPGQDAHARKRLGSGIQARIHVQAQVLRHCVPGFAYRNHSTRTALHRQGRLFQRPSGPQGCCRDAGQGAQRRAHLQLDHD